MRRAAPALLVLSLLLPGCSSEGPTAAPTSPRPAPQPNAAAAPAPGKPSRVSRTAFMDREPVVYNPERRRDPFISLVQGEAEERGFDAAGFKLAGIVWQKDQYFALLEAPDGIGHILKVNDQLGPNARVKTITKDTVLIEMKRRDARGRGQVRTIRLELLKEEGE